jgi:hypothetical protein
LISCCIENAHLPELNITGACSVSVVMLLYTFAVFLNSAPRGVVQAIFNAWDAPLEANPMFAPLRQVRKPKASSLDGVIASGAPLTDELQTSSGRVSRVLEHSKGMGMICSRRSPPAPDLVPFAMKVGN